MKLILLGLFITLIGIFYLIITTLSHNYNFSSLIITNFYLIIATLLHN